eukprot:6800848-Prymnesium_polylepis.1
MVGFLTRVREGNVLECHHGWRDLGRVREDEAELWVFDRPLGEPRLDHLVDDLLLRLRLLHQVGVGTARGDEVLEVLNVVLLLLVCLHLAHLVVAARLDVRRVVTRVEV